MDKPIPTSAEPPTSPASAARDAESTRMLIVQIMLSRAAELGRAGEYDNAEILLRDLIRTAATPAALDLLARVLAQQQRYAEARKLWNRVLDFEPHHAAALAAIEYIDRRTKKEPDGGT